jgi:hypothetical protein
VTNPEYDSTPVDSNELSDFDEIPAAEDSDFTSVPDGKYTCSVERVELTRTKTGLPMLRWSLRILGPSHQGRMLFKNSVIAEKSVGYLKRDLRRCGLELPKFSDLPDHLSELLDVVLEVNKVTKGENENLFLNKRLQAPASGESAPKETLPPF